jgi:glycosyltransferase involved in cell wall biosynthesis
MGYGAALQTGFKYAAIKGYEYVIHLDGDGQHEPEYISKILSELQQGQLDIVIGSRFLGPNRFGMTLAKRLGIFFFRTLVSILIKQKITDPTSGFRGLNKKAIRFYVTDIYPDDFPDADVIIMSHLAGLKIKEIPVTMYPNTTRKSMHRGPLRPLYYIFKVLLSILVILLRKKPRLIGDISHGY